MKKVCRQLTSRNSGPKKTSSLGAQIIPQASPMVVSSWLPKWGTMCV